MHRGFDVFVQASDSEGSPYSLLEAMASATPVIATAVGDAPALVGDGVHGLLVPPGDAGALRGWVDRLCARPEIIGGWRAAIPRVKDMEAHAAEIEAIYREVLARRKPPGS